MKIVLLGDTHFGVRNDSKSFHSYYQKFYDEVFFPYIDENKIEYVLQLGDLFDRRKYINFLTLSESKKYFFDRIENKGIRLISLLGNHDIFWKESLSVNSPELLLQSYNYIDIIQQPSTIKCAGLSIDMIPWICKENESKVAEFINNTKSKICIGHFEISGCTLMPGVESPEGIDIGLFKKYNKVFSGHFHTQSIKDNVQYVGTPYQLMWSDYNDPRGFHVFDTDTLETTFIKNPNEIFVKYYYNESKEDPRSIDTETFRDKIIKIIVVDKKDFTLFDNFIDKIYQKSPIDLKIVEDLSEFESSAVDDSINLEDTMTLLSEYVEGLETDADKHRLKNILREIYVEAQDYQEV